MTWNRVGQLILLGGHFHKAALSGGPFLLMEVEASLSDVRLITNIYCDKLENISDLKIFLKPSVDH